MLTFLAFAVSTFKAKRNGSPQTSCLVAFCVFRDIAPAQLYSVLRCAGFFGCFAGFVLFQCPDGCLLGKTVTKWSRWVFSLLQEKQNKIKQKLMRHLKEHRSWVPVWGWFQMLGRDERRTSRCLSRERWGNDVFWPGRTGVFQIPAPTPVSCFRFCVPAIRK